MIILEMMGGIGNQMFQYAYYLEMKKRNREVLIDKELFKGTPFKFSLGVFKNVKCQIYDGNSIYGKGFILKIKREIYRHLGKLKEENQIVGEWDSQMLEIDNCFAYGYYQNEKYFNGVEDEVRRVFSFSPGERALIGYIDMLEKHNTVSIHIRRGDYISHSDIFGGICTEEYYDNAIRIVLDSVDNPKFIVFSNDIEWSTKWIREKKLDQLTIDYTKYDDYQDWYDLCLMSHCKHNILANSSFSWWGGWLNNHENKMVLCPQVWDNLNNKRKMACKSWVEIDSTHLTS